MLLSLPPSLPCIECMVMFVPAMHVPGKISLTDEYILITENFHTVWYVVIVVSSQVKFGGLINKELDLISSL